MNNSERPQVSYLGFLHDHPNMQLKCGVDSEHVIVDKKDWEIARKHTDNLLYREGIDRMLLQDERARKEAAEKMQEVISNLRARGISFEIFHDEIIINSCDKANEGDMRDAVIINLTGSGEHEAH